MRVFSVHSSISKSLWSKSRKKRNYFVLLDISPEMAFSGAAILCHPRRILLNYLDFRHHTTSWGLGIVKIWHRCCRLEDHLDFEQYLPSWTSQTGANITKLSLLSLTVPYVLMNDMRQWTLKNLWLPLYRLFNIAQQNMRRLKFCNRKQTTNGLFGNTCLVVSINDMPPCEIFWRCELILCHKSGI